jgi:RNA polymerase sigma-70 factor, ECF subfamily
LVAVDVRELADEEAMQLVQEGSARAFEVVYDRHGGAAFSLAYRMLGNRMSAEDVTQEAFLAIWRSRERYLPARGSVRGWILGITRHRAVDALRRHAVHDRRRASAEGLEEREEAPERTEAEVVRLEEARSVRAALQSLPTEQSRVIELAYFGGFSQSEIADILETPLGTVKGRMRLGLEKLRFSLEGLSAEGMA